MQSRNSFTLQTLQSEVEEWANKNFDTSVDYHPLLGVVEEVGELAHSVLKMEQGIRGSQQEHEGNIKDAIGDITVYMCDYANRVGILLENPDAHIDSWSEQDVVEALLDVVVDLGRMSDDYLYDHVVNGPLGSILWRLNNICSVYDWDYLEVVEETWNKVSKRDWVEFPETGV